jgi:hypothetical protein
MVHGQCLTRVVTLNPYDPMKTPEYKRAGLLACQRSIKWLESKGHAPAAARFRVMRDSYEVEAVALLFANARQIENAPALKVVREASRFLLSLCLAAERRNAA